MKKIGIAVFLCLLSGALVSGDAEAHGVASAGKAPIAAPKTAPDCDDCTFDKVIGRYMFVAQLGCMEDDDKTPCHLVTTAKNAEASQRFTLLSYDAASDSYEFDLVTRAEDKGHERIQCRDLSVHHQDMRKLLGTCRVYDDVARKMKVHHAMVVVRPMENAGNNPQAEIAFWFSHRPYANEDGNVHGGEGHSHPN